jgi:hypothetical protein
MEERWRKTSRKRKEGEERRRGYGVNVEGLQRGGLASTCERNNTFSNKPGR